MRFGELGTRAIQANLIRQMPIMTCSIMTPADHMSIGVCEPLFGSIRVVRRRNASTKGPGGDPPGCHGCSFRHLDHWVPLDHPF